MVFNIFCKYFVNYINSGEHLRGMFYNLIHGFDYIDHEILLTNLG